MSREKEATQNEVASGRTIKAIIQSESAQDGRPIFKPSKTFPKPKRKKIWNKEMIMVGRNLPKRILGVETGVESKRLKVPCLFSATNIHPEIRIRLNANITVKEGTRI